MWIWRIKPICARLSTQHSSMWYWVDDSSHTQKSLVNAWRKIVDWSFSFPDPIIWVCPEAEQSQILPNIFQWGKLWYNDMWLDCWGIDRPSYSKLFLRLRHSLRRSTALVRPRWAKKACSDSDQRPTITKKWGNNPKAHFRKMAPFAEITIQATAGLIGFATK